MSATYRVKEVARLANVTVRTLHHYDSIGLLQPSARTAAGYRLYGDDDLARLQQILLWRALGLSLEAIGQMLDDPAFDRREALIVQRDLLRERATKTEAMIRAIDTTLATLDTLTPLTTGDDTMDAKQMFDGFDPADYADEAEQRWGDTDAYKESARRARDYTSDDWARIKAESADIVARLVAARADGAAPDSDRAMAVAEDHRLHIERWFYPCGHKMHVCLGDMYVADPRFTATYDAHGEGTAAYLADAIRANAARA